MTTLIGIITVRGGDYPPTARLAQAAADRGCGVALINPYTVWPAFRQGRPVLLGHPAALGLSAVLPRQGAEIKEASLPLLLHFEKMGLPVINAQAAVIVARHKFFTLQTLAAAGLPVLDTVFVSARDGLHEALACFGDAGAVVKPISGRQGRDVRRLLAGDAPGERLLAELDRGRGLLVQRYLPPEGRLDLRVVVIGGKIVAAMRLEPVAGEFRANAHQGGQGRPVHLSAAEADLALRSAAALGLEIAGVDLMIAADGRPVVNEVNYSPGFRMLESATGADVAGAMIDYTLGRIARPAAGDTIETECSGA